LITDPSPEEQSETDNAGARRGPAMPDHEEITREQPTPFEFAFAKIRLTRISWRTRHFARAWQQWLAKPLWIQLTVSDFEVGS
jgi:hypothetical protein